MITNWLVRGDTHAQFAWMYNDNSRELPWYLSKSPNFYMK